VKTKKNGSATEAVQRSPGESAMDRYALRLYVTGTTVRSVRAIANIRRICQKHLRGQYELEVVDIFQRPQLAAGQQILALPTLVKTRPLPRRRMIGDLSDTDRVLMSLDLKPTAWGPDRTR
jgi:circadian clock protein KaiB